ncbi:MAG: diguanylate cyclase [Oscillospiraceae bacterium]
MFNKHKQDQVEQMVSGILDAQDSDVLVVRGKACETLFMNTAAQARVKGQLGEVAGCKAGYTEVFPELCDHCPNLEPEENKEPEPFDVRDKNGHIFSATCHVAQWVDGKPATFLFLRDVTEERSGQKKLYNLAYIDQLTGVPNRQKFKEDFEALAEDINNNRVAGIVAIFDLDNFKSVNDTYGHNTGDVMLRRLTEHLSSDAAFSGHIYRLGGDEFVLMYVDKAGRHATEEECRGFYAQVLQGAFLSYTMPNIEIACTISMGVALFPKHGTNASELLRKADIALYQAKTSGRNKLVFFEDHYDTAKKFRDLYINIQPILTHLGRTYGYELIDRGNEGMEGEDALNLSDFDRTMDALGLGEMQSEARYFISFTNQLLSKTVLNNLPREKFIVQIPAGDTHTDKQMQKYAELRQHGYKLALTGLTPANATPALMALATYCKFEPGQVDGFEQKSFIAKHPDKWFVATGVDTDSAFEDAKRRGYKLFQGFFFSEPVVVKKTKDIDPMKINYIRLLKLTSTDDYVDFREISAVIASDVALSYKLLRLLNSAALGLRNKISSIDMAVAYLGEESLKKWIAMLALRGIASDKPLELVRMSLIRAQFAEQLAPHFMPRRDARHVFLVGMFSLLHIALEKTKEEVLAEIPVADEISASLLTNTGPHSDLVSLFSNYEYANWDEVTRFARDNGLTDRQINDAYIAAVKWYNSLAEDDEPPKSGR